MKIKKDHYQAVYVEWIDSVRENQTWCKFEDIKDYYKKPQSIMKTVGYLISENKLEYVFCSTLHFDKKECVYSGNVFSIPKGCVLKIKKITRF